LEFEFRLAGQALYHLSHSASQTVIFVVVLFCFLNLVFFDSPVLFFETRVAQASPELSIA
jgi:hypothetical protein